MKIKFITLITALLILPMSAKAVIFDLGDIRASINADNTVGVGKNIILDASQSFLPDKEEPANYVWDFGDGSPTRTGINVVHSYQSPGQYMLKLTVRQGEKESAVQTDITVYEKMFLLLTDFTERAENIENLKESALDDNTFINLVESYESETAFMSEETLTKKLTEKENDIRSADAIVIWTVKGSGISSLTRFVRERPNVKASLADKTMVVVTDKDLHTLGRIMQSNFEIISPKQIILTREYELRNLIAAESIESFVADLKSGASEHKMINAETHKVQVWNFISYLVNIMIAKGIPSNTIVLLLMLPVIATIISFLKQVIGVTTFGLYTPSIITLSFLALGLKFGLLILILILATGTVLRMALEHVHLLHIPRVAIIFSISTLIILLTLAFATYLGITDLATIAVFPMLIMATLAEKFVTAQSGKGVYAALILMAETTIVSLICYWIVEWQYLQNLMLGYPEIILLLIIINLILGRWTGLRLFEYIRFREVMKHAEE